MTGGRSAGPPTWAELLDALEERLRAQEAVVAGTSRAAPGGDLPAPEEPLPPRLGDRARILLAWCEELEGRARAELARRRPAGRPYG